MSPLLNWSPEELQKFMVTRIPFNEFNGLKVVHIAEGELMADLPFDPRLVGDREANTLHEGPITTLIDTICGSVALTVMDEPRRTATLDLRIDFLRRPAPATGLRCEAQIMSLDEHIATIRGTVHEGDPARPVAVATATFAVFPPRSAAAPGAAP